MTAAEMETEVNLRSQKINSNVNDDFLSQEIAVYLNRSVNEFVSDRLLPESNYLKEGFEQSIKRVDDLRALVEKDNALDTEYVSSNAAIHDFYVDRAAFPNNYRHLLSVRFKVQYSKNGVTFTTPSSKRIIDGTLDTDYKEKIVPGKFFQQDDVQTALEDPFNKTRILTPIFDVNTNGIDGYTDDKFIIDKIIINYIREPAEIVLDPDTPANNVDCDLAEHTHPEIVDKAVKMILADIEKFGPQGLLQDLEETE